MDKFFDAGKYALAFPIPILKLTPLWTIMVKHTTILGEFIKQNIENAIKKNETDNSLAGTVLEKMILRCGKDSGVPVAMCMDALGAGTDTTGSQATMLLYHLAANPDKQEILNKEICEVVGATGGKMTEETLAQMRYLKACQTESMRLAYIAPFTARETQVNSTFITSLIMFGTFF